MATPVKRRRDLDPDLEFLVVDDFLRDLIGARALKTAFELGLVDHLMARHPSTLAELGETVKQADRTGLTFLLDLLTGAGVMENRNGGYSLTAAFRIAMRYRDLLEAKLDFSGFLAADYLELFTGLVVDPPGFMKRARLFQLFDYRRALEPGTENYERTRAWMRLTTTLTRYEALGCLKAHDFSTARTMLDVGGNSGEFALQACRRHPQLRAAVADLPLVCEIGQEHVLPEPERDRITFIKGDVRQQMPAGPYDLITFKSMLHDWPEELAKDFLTRAAQALEPGGNLLVFERAPLDVTAGPPPFSSLPTLLFFRSYRDPAVYAGHLLALGFTDIQTREIALEVPFFVVTGKKPASRPGTV
ncbi:MAG TPA: methyltransferase [Burkholderiales bacterium]|nr:methyltransferase [Burkholderiales bacterium]